MASKSSTQLGTYTQWSSLLGINQQLSYEFKLIDIIGYIDTIHNLGKYRYLFCNPGSYQRPVLLERGAKLARFSHLVNYIFHKVAGNNLAGNMWKLPQGFSSMWKVH